MRSRRASPPRVLHGHVRRPVCEPTSTSRGRRRKGIFRRRPQHPGGAHGIPAWSRRVRCWSSMCELPTSARGSPRWSRTASACQPPSRAPSASCVRLGTAIEDSRVPRNPCDGVRLPKRKHSDRGYLSHAQVAALAFAVERHGRVSAELQLACACVPPRCREVSGERRNIPDHHAARPASYSSQPCRQCSRQHESGPTNARALRHQ